MDPRQSIPGQHNHPKVNGKIQHNFHPSHIAYRRKHIYHPNIIFIFILFFLPSNDEGVQKVQLNRYANGFRIGYCHFIILIKILFFGIFLQFLIFTKIKFFPKNISISTHNYRLLHELMDTAIMITMNQHQMEVLII